MADRFDDPNLFLQPGDVFFGRRRGLVRTLLGSCVAITVWHPRLQVGGMCHFMLPRRLRAGSDALDGRYADEAMSLLQIEMRRIDTTAADYEMKAFGAGTMLPTPASPSDCGSARGTWIDVAGQNALAARDVAYRAGTRVISGDMGGTLWRQLAFNLETGRVLCRCVQWTRPGSATLERSNLEQKY